MRKCLGLGGLIVLLLAPVAGSQSVESVDPAKAFDLLKNPSTFLVDVRSVAEYVLIGHPDGAYSVPITFWNENKAAFEPNDKFVEDLRIRFKPEDTLIFICRSGGRSLRAAEAAGRAGFAKSLSVSQGFEGEPDAAGHRTVGGWKNSGLPWTTKIDPKLAYAFQPLPPLTPGSSAPEMGQAGTPPPPQPDPAPQVDRIFERWDKTVSPGGAVAVMKGGRIIYERGFGMADLDHDVTITPKAVFHVASMSKQFTAASILLLEQDGRLSLDDEIHRFIPELPDFGVKITLRHLIHHTSGLRDQWELLGLAGWRYSKDRITDDDVLAVLSRQKELNFKPGERYLYCNTGYTLLAITVKRVSGMSFREFTKARIFDPLGMKSTHFRDDFDEIVKGMAYGYVASGNTFKLAVTNFDTAGATSLLTTVEDLALWDENFYNPKVGGKALIGRMLERGKLNGGETLDYAGGLTLGTYKGLPFVEHSGGDAGYRSDMIRFPEQHFSVAILCNQPLNPTGLARQVADIYLANDLKPEPARPDEPGLKLPPGKMAAVLGTYINPDDDSVRRIAVVNDVLRTRQALSTVGLELRAKSDLVFRPLGLGIEVRFEPLAGGGMRMLEVPDSGAKPSLFVRTPDFAPKAPDLAEYAGEYRSDEIEPVYRVTIRDGKLAMEMLKEAPIPMTPVVKDLFLGDLGQVRFVRDGRGKVAGFIINRGRILHVRFRKTGEAVVPRDMPPIEKGAFRDADLVEIASLDPSIKLDIRYARADNFTGRPVYPEARAFLQRPAAQALARVQRGLKDKGYGLVVFDGYRPWAVTKLFWDLTPADKRNFVADPKEGSKHNRGCAVDLSLIDLKTGHEIEMPSPFDEMSGKASASYAGGTAAQRERRDVLRRAMEKEGFEVYPDEWWHFDYKDWSHYRVLDVPFKGVADSSFSHSSRHPGLQK